MAKIFAGYQSLPTGTTLTFKYKENNDSSYTSMTTVNDTENVQLYAEASPNGRALQFRIEFTINSNDAPVIEHIGIDLAN